MPSTGTQVKNVNKLDSIAVSLIGSPYSLFMNNETAMLSKENMCLDLTNFDPQLTWLVSFPN